MNLDSRIVITGAAGFIGSCLTAHLNAQGFSNLILVDDFSVEKKKQNWLNQSYSTIVQRSIFFSWLSKNTIKIDAIIHLGARTDTMEFNTEVHKELNFVFSKDIWKYCTKNHILLIYASSAATYGSGSNGYSDSHAIVNYLRPLNPYGISKNDFDKWAIKQKKTPKSWAGLKFFNVYGPNEYHKGPMASIIWQSFNQVQKNGSVELFKSHNPDYNDGEQLRDFIYIKDVLRVIFWMLTNMSLKNWDLGMNGLYNLGTGEARTFRDLVHAVFLALGRQPQIKYIDMPEKIRTNYQYFTKADMSKLLAAGYERKFFTIENGVNDYVWNYLMANSTFRP